MLINSKEFGSPNWLSQCEPSAAALNPVRIGAPIFIEWKAGLNRGVIWLGNLHSLRSPTSTCRKPLVYYGSLKRPSVARDTQAESVARFASRGHMQSGLPTTGPSISVSLRDERIARSWSPGLESW